MCAFCFRLYDRYLGSRLVHYGCALRPFSAARQHVIPCAKGTVVEIGFGSGLNLSHYDPAKVDALVAVDPDIGALAHGLRRSAGTPHTIQTLTVTGECIPLHDNYADSIVITYALCTIPEPAAALAEAKRILKEGGRLFFAEHGRADTAWDSGWRRRANRAWGVLAKGCHLNRNPLAFIRGAGFELKNIQTEPFPPFLRHLGQHYSGFAVNTREERDRKNRGTAAPRASD